MENEIIRFEHDTSIDSERGIIILDEQNKIISINDHAKALFPDLKTENGFIFLSDLGKKFAKDVGKAKRVSAGKRLNFCCYIGLKKTFIHMYYSQKYCVLEIFAVSETYVDTVDNIIYTSIFDKIIDCFFDGIYVTRNDGLTLKVSNSYERLTGIGREEVVGKYMDDIVKEGILSQSATKRIVETKMPYTYEQTTRVGKTVTSSGTPIFDEDGEVANVIFNVRDVTELNRLKNELNKSREIADYYRKQIEKYNDNPENYVVCENPGFKKTLAIAERAAKYDSTIMILGESGVGKEVIANYIVNNSSRANMPFIKINCGAINENLLESELFGYVGGAFTGASKSGHMGAFELANKGTIFLDEIGEMPYHLQVKLLRVLQERKISRVGSTKEIPIDIRIISATNKDLEKMVEKKQFREDLYYRLKVIPINVPPLRERKEDIFPLINIFINKFNKKYNTKKVFDPEVFGFLTGLKWPGNVRELQNMVEYIIVESIEDTITLENIKALYPEKVEEFRASELKVMNLNEAKDQLERDMIVKAMEKYKTTQKAAEILGISQASVSRKYAKYKSMQN